MSKIKALESLREWVRLFKWDNMSWEARSESFELLPMMLDEIENEIEEFYMPLPLDAYGVSIRIGDIVQHYGHTGNVWMIGMDEFMCTDHVCYSMNECRHVKHRTLEDVLIDYARDFHNTLSVFEAGESSGLSPHELVDKYAEEIRELMEG